MYNRNKKSNTAKIINETVGYEINTLLNIMEKQSKILLYFLLWLLILTAMIIGIIYDIKFIS